MAEQLTEFQQKVVDFMREHDTQIYESKGPDGLVYFLASAARAWNELYGRKPISHATIRALIEKKVLVKAPTDGTRYYRNDYKLAPAWQDNEAEDYLTAEEKRREKLMAELRIAIKERGWTQARVARMVEKSGSWISTILRGHYPHYGANRLPRYLAEWLEKQGIEVPEELGT